MNATEQSALCRSLGHRVIHAISRVTVVTPHGLVASAILNCSNEQFSADSLIAIVEIYLRYLSTQKAKLADTLVYDSYHAIQQALNSYVQRKFVEPLTKDKEQQSSETIYRINADKRAHLEYYKNNCIAFFIPAAFTALAILEKDTSRFSTPDLHDGYAFLQDFFKYEFAYDADQTVADFVHKSINAFVDDAVLTSHPNLPGIHHLTPAGLRKLKLFSIFLKTYFESYWIVLNFFMQTPRGAARTKDRLKKIAYTGSQMYKRREIERKEALNKVSYQNAVDFFTSRGVKGSDNTDEIEFYAQVIKRALKYLQV